MPQSGNTGGQERRTLVLLGSLCLFLSAVEYLIPKPFPFMRIGLANLPLLLALDIFCCSQFFLLVLIKVLGQGIISGSLFSYVFLFSAAGTFSSALIMFVMRHVTGSKQGSFAGVGCAGAMISNGVQLMLAWYFVFGAGIRFLVPPFLASGLVTGTGIGLFCEFFCHRSRWYAKHTISGNTGLFFAAENSMPSAENDAVQDDFRQRRRERWNELFSGGELFAAGFVMAVLFLLNPSILFRLVQFIFFCLFVWLSGKKINFVITLLVMVGIIFFNLLVPYGKIFASFFSFRITQGSLTAGIEKALALEGLFMLSRAFVKTDLHFPGGAGLLLSESFRLLELMLERKNLISRGRVIAGIDQLMLEIEAADTDCVYAEERGRRKFEKFGEKAKRLLIPGVMIFVTAFCTLYGFLAGKI